MGISVRRTRDSGACLSVTGPASVRVASEARTALLALLDEGRRVRLDLSRATSADVAFVQLIASARRTFEDRGCGFEVRDPDRLLAAAVPGWRGVTVTDV